MNEFVMALKEWVIPLVSIAIAIWFASAAKHDADRAQDILNRINAAVEGWQQKIMASTANILDSLPQVVEGRTTLARVEAARALSEGIQTAIHEIAKNPDRSAVGGHIQNEHLKVLVAQLNELLQSMASRR